MLVSVLNMNFAHKSFAHKSTQWRKCAVMQREFPDGYGFNQGMLNSEVYVSKVEAINSRGPLIHPIQIRVRDGQNTMDV
jgi:hypothetical protein